MGGEHRQEAHRKMPGRLAIGTTASQGEMSEEAETDSAADTEAGSDLHSHSDRALLSSQLHFLALSSAFSVLTAVLLVASPAGRRGSPVPAWLGTG